MYSGAGLVSGMEGCWVVYSPDPTAPKIALVAVVPRVCECV